MNMIQYKEKYVSNDIIDVPLNFYDIDETQHILHDEITKKENYVVRNGLSVPLFNFNTNDSNDVISPQLCNTLYKEKYRNNDIRDVPLSYYYGPNRSLDLIDHDESTLIKFLHNIDASISGGNKETYVNNDIVDVPLIFYHIDNFDEDKHIKQIYKENYVRNYVNNNDRNISLKISNIDDFNEEKYVNYLQ